MTEIWFIRHGETDWNRARRMQGWQNIGLNTVGIDQARRLAERLAGQAAAHPFDAIYSSDLTRTLDTARPASEQLALRLRPEPGLRERSYGVLEGLHAHERQSLQPEAYLAWKSRSADAPMPGGETLGQFRARIVSTVRTIAAAHAGQRILAFTHGGVLDIIWRHAHGIDLAAKTQAPLLNVSINLVHVDEPAWRVARWGDVAHIKAEVGDDVAP